MRLDFFLFKQSIKTRKKTMSWHSLLIFACKLTSTGVTNIIAFGTAPFVINHQVLRLFF